MKQKQIDKINEIIRKENNDFPFYIARIKKRNKCYACYKGLDRGMIVFKYVVSNNPRCFNCAFDRLNEVITNDYYNNKIIEIKLSNRDRLKDLRLRFKNNKKIKILLDRYKEDMIKHNIIEAI